MMKRFIGDLKNYVLCSLLLFLCGTSNFLVAMEAAVLDEMAGTAFEGLSESAQQTFAESVSAEMGGLSEEAFGQLSTDAQAAFKEEVGSALKNAGAKIEEVGGNLDKLTDLASDLGQEVKGNFVNKIATEGSMTPGTEMALKSFNLSEEQLGALDKVDVIPDKFETPEGVTSEVTPAELKTPGTEASISSDELTARATARANASDQLTQAIEGGESEDVVAKLQKNVDDLNSPQEDAQAATEKGNFDTKSQQAQEDASKLTDDATKAADDAAKNQQSAEDKADTDLYEKTKKETLIKDKAVADAKAEQATTDRTSAKEKLDQARADKQLAESNVKQGKIAGNKATLDGKVADNQLIAANKELASAQDELGKLDDSATPEAKENAETKVKDAQEKVDKATADKTDAEQRLKDANKLRDQANEDLKVLNGDAATEGSIRKLQIDYLDTTSDWVIGERVGSALKTGLSSTSKWLGEKVSETVSTTFQALLFMAPSLALSQYQSYMGTQSLLDTLKKVQSFGNILMKIPSQFINEDQPQLSKFIYVGLENSDTELTNEYLKTANYYVTKPDFGDAGSVGLTDPGFTSNVMLHLNTGYVFGGDGGPANADSPTIPIIHSDDPQVVSLVATIEALVGGIKQGPSTTVSRYIVTEQSASYSGSDTIGTLFSEIPNGPGYPPLLNGMISSLQNGTSFGPFRLQGIRDLDTETLGLVQRSVQGDQGNSSSSAALPLVKQQAPYVVQGIHIYQTQDTPLIQSVLATLATDDPDNKLLHEDLVDYLVMLNREKNYEAVALETPVPAAGVTQKGAAPVSQFASYQLNPHAGDYYYMYSLLDGSLYGSSPNKVKLGALPNIPETQALLNATTKTIGSYLDTLTSQKVPQLIKEIVDVRTYIEKKVKYGPFVYGSSRLTIDPSLVDDTIFVYCLPASLEGGGDDYLVPVKIGTLNPTTNQPSLQAVQLPSSKPNFFVSLVTSRMYDANLKPYTAPLYKASPYYIIAPKEDEKEAQVVIFGNKINLPAVKNTYAIYATASAPLFTLFMDPDINPNPVPTLSQAVEADTVGLSENMLPVQFQWALNGGIVQHPVPGETGVEDIKTLLSDKPIYHTIQEAYEAWKKVVTKTDIAAITHDMAPAKFTTQLLQNIYLNATSPADIKNGNYVYTSASYPGEYLVMATDPAGSQGLAQQFNTINPQQYAISLSSGNVYDSASDGKSISHIDDLIALTKNAQSAEAQFLPTLAKEIASSQAVLLTRINKKLYGNDVTFGPYVLYLNRQDYQKGQFIYADVSGKPSPIQANGQENENVVKQVNDYFVCFGPAPKFDGDGKPVIDPSTNQQETEMQFGVPLSYSVETIVSLISGAVFDRGGAYAAKITQFDFANQTFDSPLKFTEDTYEAIIARSGSALRPALKQAITALTDQATATYQKEKAEIVKDKQKEAMYTKELDGNLMANLNSAPYIAENPLLEPRFLKKYNNKYYKVTPADPNTSTPQLFLDYAVNEGAKPGSPDDIGIIYNADRSVRVVLKGWILEMMRLAAGVEVTASGQQLGIGFSRLALPMKLGNDSAMVKTPITASPSGYKVSFEYNQRTDGYYANISGAGIRAPYIYVDLVTGYSYSNDGTPRLKESKIFTGPNGDILYVALDTYNVPRFLYKSLTPPAATSVASGSQAPEIVYHPYSVTNIKPSPTDMTAWENGTSTVQPAWASFSGSFNNKTTEYGKMYVATNDDDPSQSLKIGSVVMDSNYQQAGATGSALPQPYYLVWDYTSLKLLGKYTIDTQRNFTHLTYVQTRKVGAPVTSGVYVESDAMNDSTELGLSLQKPVGLIISAKEQRPLMLLYGKSLVPFQGTGDKLQASVTLPNGNPQTLAVTLNRDEKNGGSWLSLSDGTNQYDYVYQFSSFDTTAQLNCPPASANLDCLKRDSWLLNVTSFVPSTAQGVNKAGVMSSFALASNLNPSTSAGAVEFPASVAESEQKLVNHNAQPISLDPSGKVYYYSAQGKSPQTIKRFVYKFDADVTNNAALLSDFNPAWNGWYVDLASGILYQPTTEEGMAYPAGGSLLPSQLAELLDSLEISVGLDAETGLPDKLKYRSVTPQAAALKKSSLSVVAGG